MRRPEEVFVLVRRGEEYLILHRSKEQGGYWHSVAGGLEEGESSAAGAARELREETGLEAPVVQLERRFVYRLEEWEPRFRPEGGEIHVECFLAEAPAGWEPSLDWEHDDYRWCRAEEGAELLFWPEPRELLQELGAQ
jgi:8-oxo-dGTP pyrophosphatase MutT (NUDIX family)